MRDHRKADWPMDGKNVPLNLRYALMSDFCWKRCCYGDFAMTRNDENRDELFKWSDEFVSRSLTVETNALEIKIL